MHLSIVKRIFPNSWVLESWFYGFEYYFEKAHLGLFPYRAYVSHKNDRPDLTQRVLWSIKGLVVNLFLVASNPSKAWSVYRGYFPLIWRLCFKSENLMCEKKSLRERNICALEVFSSSFLFFGWDLNWSY